MPSVEIIVVIEESYNAEEAKRKQEEQRIVSKIEQLKELEKLIEEAKDEVEVLKDEIKEEMEKHGKEEMIFGKYIVRWTEVLSNRFDSTAFKKLFPAVYKDFTKPSVSRRFTISG